MPCKLVGVTEHNMDKNMTLTFSSILLSHCEFKLMHKQGNTPSRMGMDNGSFRRPSNPPGLDLEKDIELILQTSGGPIP